MVNLIAFIKIVGKLKGLKRAGWVEYQIPDSESVAEHCFQLALLTMILAPKFNLDANKAIKMALVHDLGEAEIGDIIISKGGKILPNLKNKLSLERKALEKILKLINGKEYLNLFDEYNENKTKEAQFVKQLDKLEMAFQALEYEQKYGKNLDEFFKTAESALENEELKEIFNQLVHLRTKVIPPEL